MLFDIYGGAGSRPAHGAGMSLLLSLILLTLSASVAAQGEPGSQSYRMGPGDRLQINVYNTPELSLAVRINESGHIGYPLLGEIELTGKTEQEAASTIASRLEQENILRDPQVTVTVTEFRSRRVSVLGAVTEPGEYYLAGDRTLVDMLGKAGWIKPDGADYVLLTRKNEQGERQQYRVDLRELTSGQYRSMQAQAGDVLYVPKQEVFYIQGAVNSPGAYRYQDGMTVMEALSLGGGLTPRGSRGRIEIKRRNEEGEMGTYDAEPEDELSPGDIVYVKERLF